jgi:endoglucanase
MKLRLLISMILALLASPTLTSATPSLAAPDPAAGAASSGPVTNFIGDYFELRNVGSNKFAIVKDRLVSAGALVLSWSCANADNDLWNPLALGNGFYWLVNRNCGLCLDIRTNAQVLDGLVLQQFPCSMIYPSEQWRFNTIIPGRFQISSAAATTKCFDLQSGSTSNSARLQMWTCSLPSGNLSQTWRLT